MNFSNDEENCWDQLNLSLGLWFEQHIVLRSLFQLAYFSFFLFFTFLFFFFFFFSSFFPSPFFFLSLLKSIATQLVHYKMMETQISTWRFVDPRKEFRVLLDNSHNIPPSDRQIIVSEIWASTIDSVFIPIQFNRRQNRSEPYSTHGIAYWTGPYRWVIAGGTSSTNKTSQ